MTTDIIRFNHTKLDNDVLDDLKGVVTPATQLLLRTAFDHGGFIAGGFGLTLARHYLRIDNQGNLRTPDEFRVLVRHHLGNPVTRDTDPSPYRNSGCSDIDLSFPDQPALNRFMTDPRYREMTYGHTAPVKVSASLTDAAIDHIVPNDARVQVITRYTGSIKERLADFDIYNAMAGIHDNILVCPEHWIELENKSVLHVSKWGAHTPSRVLRYLRRKRYNQLSPSTVDGYWDALMKAVEIRIEQGDKALKNVDNQFVVERALRKGAYGVQGMLYPMLKSLSPERLLQVSALFTSPIKYDFAMQELMKRSSPR